MRWMVLLVFLGGCDKEIKISGCDEYCDVVIEKTKTCAEEDGTSFDDFAGAPENEVHDACQADVDASERTEAECNTETAAIDGSTCDQIESLVTTLTQ